MTCMTKVTSIILQGLQVYSSYWSKKSIALSILRLIISLFDKPVIFKFSSKRIAFDLKVGHSTGNIFN